MTTPSMDSIYSACWALRRAWMVAAVLWSLTLTACATTPTTPTFEGGAMAWADLRWSAAEGDADVWCADPLGPPYRKTVEAGHWVVHSRGQGEEGVGALRSEPFTITGARQTFALAGADGTTDTRNGGRTTHLLLRSHPDGAILRTARPPGGIRLKQAGWFTWNLMGREVYLELVDGNPMINPKGFAWIGLADYQQIAPEPSASPVTLNNLHGVPIDDGARLTVCRTVPFMAAPLAERGATRRIWTPPTETIPVGAQADTIYLLGMMNPWWDHGVAHWGEHPEKRAVRDDIVHVGSQLGELEIRYEGGTSDRIPLVVGATVWFYEQWMQGTSHGRFDPIQEPFASRPELMDILRRALRIREAEDRRFDAGRYGHYYLAVRPRPLKIESLVIHDNPALRGGVLVSGVTLATDHPTEGLQAFGEWSGDAADFASAIDAAAPEDWTADLEALAKVLYTSDADLPSDPELLEFPRSLDAARIRFIGSAPDIPALGAMLSNIWVQNMMQMAVKFEPDTGMFYESAIDGPWYGGYNGIGTWRPTGVYRSTFPRCSDAYASLILRLVDNPERNTNYTDFVDKWLYFYRADHRPDRGPPNAWLDIDRYPADAPGHWSFGCPPGGPPVVLNELPGDEEMDGHGATAVVRWLTWRHMGGRADEWLMAPRDHLYGKSRWATTIDAAEFICWLLDYTGMDVVYCEGEVTGWGGPWRNQVPEGMGEAADMETLRHNYANSDMYEPYPSYVCLTALRCSAEMADVVGRPELAERWRTYAERIRKGMLRLLVVGDSNHRTWRLSPHSVLPSHQDALVQAWFSIYLDGLDPQRFDPKMTAVTLNTLADQLNQPYGHAPALGMGYGMGWITKSALVLDQMDDAAKLMANIARYVYDKNMDYVDPERGIDWREFAWIVPEGTNILPDGRWHRIGDLSNGANQGPVIHALELCAGVDDTHAREELRLLPRVIEPLTGIAVEDFPALVPDEDGGLARAKIDYTYDRVSGVFSLTSDRELPKLAVRLGPFENAEAARAWSTTAAPPEGATTRIEVSGRFHDRPAHWVWIEGLTNVKKVEFGVRAQ